MAMVWAHPDRQVGMASHLVAGVACGVVWARSGRAPRLALVLGLLELFLLLDAAFNWRWQIHGRLVSAAMARHLYGGRKLPQELVLGLLLGAVAAAMIFVFRRYRGRPGACVAVCGALISAAFWLIEVISLHQTDAVLEHSVGPIMRIALVWIVSTLMTAIGILRDVKRPVS